MPGNLPVTLLVAKMRSRSFRVADVKHTPRVPLHMNWIMHGAFQKVRTWVRSSVVQLRDPFDVVSSLGKVRHPGAARHGSLARVIGGQGQPYVAAIALHE